MSTNEQNYRPLGPDEVIQEGDEYKHLTSTVWGLCIASTVETPKQWPNLEFRRPIPAEPEPEERLSEIASEVEHNGKVLLDAIVEMRDERDRLQSELAKCREAFDSIREILVSSKLQVENQKALTTGTHALLDSLKKQIREISRVAFERAASIKAALEGGK